MRAHWFGASGSIVALLMTLSGAHAQDKAGTVGGVTAGGVSASPNAVRSSASGNTSTSVEIGGVQTRAAVTPAEQLAQAETISRRAEQLATKLTKLLDESRRDKDIMRANCINRKLTEVNANARNIEQRAQALKAAAATNDEARRSHEFTVLSVLAQKLEALDQEATQCLGQSVYEPGASQVVTTIQGGNPTFDPTTINPATAVPPTIAVPPPLSATL
jgi:hypothetical protein